MFPYSLTVMHMSVCSQTGLYQTASTLSFARKSAAMNANEQRRAARLRVANRLVFIPANLRAKENTCSPGLQKSPTSLKLETRFLNCTLRGLRFDVTDSHAVPT